MTEAFNVDCMVAMKQIPDKFYTLAIVDPPYGGGVKDAVQDTETAGISSAPIVAARTGGKWFAKINGGKKITHWDTAPTQEYFDELARVSENQIIWGGNYFGLPPTRCFLVWDKINISENFTMSMCEYAWTSFNSNAKIFRCRAQTTEKNRRIHPTQKPIELYIKTLKMFAKPGDKILDTHMGSGSSRIAAYELNMDYTGYEIDKEYFEAEEERFRQHTAQMSLFHTEI